MPREDSSFRLAAQAGSDDRLTYFKRRGVIGTTCCFASRATFVMKLRSAQNQPVIIAKSRCSTGSSSLACTDLRNPRGAFASVSTGLEPLAAEETSYSAIEHLFCIGC